MCFDKVQSQIELIGYFEKWLWNEINEDQGSYSQKLLSNFVRSKFGSVCPIQGDQIGLFLYADFDFGIDEVAQINGNIVSYFLFQQVSYIFI